MLLPMSTTCKHENAVSIDCGSTRVGDWCPYCGSVKIYLEWREPVFFTLNRAFELIAAKTLANINSTGPAPAMQETGKPPPVTNSVETPSDVEIRDSR